VRGANPFQPGAGAVPQVWVGRNEPLLAADQQRRDRVRGRYTPGAIVVGPSGIGKSVLVNRVAQEAVVRGDVVVPPVRIARRSDPVAQLAGEVDRAARDVARGRGLVRDAVIALGEHLARENLSRTPGTERALLIRVDELQNATSAQRSALIAALGDALEARVALDAPGVGGVEAHLPIVLFLTGLPDLLNAASNVDTFRRRFTTTVLRPFSDAEVEDALLDTPMPGDVVFDRGAASGIAAVVAGDPYLFQLVGRHAWDASDGPVVTTADVAAADTATYAERLRIVEATAADFPDREREVLHALFAVADEYLTAAPSAVADHIGLTVPQIATAAARLERRAAIERTPHGWTVTQRLLHRYLTTGDVHPTLDGRTGRYLGG